MMSYVIDGVLLLALLLTALRVGAMYRELKRLRGYQSQYVEVFGETSRAASHIGDAVRQLGGEGRHVLERLEAAMDEARALTRRLEAAARPRSEAAIREGAQADGIGTYSRRGLMDGPAGENESGKFKSEILKFGSDNRPFQDRRDDAAGGTPSLPPAREFRLAPSVKTLRTASGNG